MEKENFCVDLIKFFNPIRNTHRSAILGELVQGIVHNLNGSLQLLNLNFGFLEKMIKQEKCSPSIIIQLEKCMDCIDKLRGFIEILTEKEDQEKDLKFIQINDLLEEQLVFFQNNLFFKHQVKVNKRLSRRIQSVYGHPHDFRQVFSNLIQNSIEALENSPVKEMALITESQDSYISVTIEDTGVGISEKVRPHLFKPFVTTKQEKHLGLGLFIVRRILDHYGGSIRFNSQKKGTSFFISIPLKPKFFP